MAFDEDPDKVQREQINKTIKFVQEQERIVQRMNYSINKLYSIMASYHPPDSDLKPFFDRFVVIHAMLRVLVADVKLYNEENYTAYMNAS